MPKSALIAALLLALATGGWAQDPIAPTPAPAPAPASPASASPAQAPAPAPAPFVWEPWMKPRVDADSNKGLRPQRLQAYNRTHYFQLLPAEDAVGTVVFLHGCARQARAFFPFDPKHCKECVGLPEHVSHTKQALALGYNVLALDPSDKRHDCWSSSNSRKGYGNDQPDVITTVADFLQVHNLTEKRLVLWGASSGGTLALKLPGAQQQRAEAAAKAQWRWREAVKQWGRRKEAWERQAAAAAANQTRLAGNETMRGSGTNETLHLNGTQPAGNGTLPFNETRPLEPEPLVSIRIDAIISEVSAPDYTDFGAFDKRGRLAVEGYPPTTFVVMERDGSLERAERNVELFGKSGVPSGVVVSPVRNIDRSFFAKRSPLISYQQSHAIVAGLQGIGLLAENGTLLADPAEEEDPALPSYRWSVRLQEALPWLSGMPRLGKNPVLSLALRTSSIRMALYLAYAKHDAVSDYFSACIKFLEGRGKEPLPALARRLKVPGGRLAALEAFSRKDQQQRREES